MIKKILPAFLLLMVVLGCDSDKGLNCFQTAGDIIQQEFTVDDFTKITVEERVQLILKQGQQKIIIETGENLMNDIDVSVKDGVLTVFNNNGCNLVRDYNITKAIITSPNITEIRNASGYEVQSDGVLAYPALSLISEDLDEEDFYHKDGDFRLELDVQELQIMGNGLSNYYLSGHATSADIEILEGDARFEGRDLLIDDLYIYHRGTNQVIVNPQLSLRGQILSTGDLIAVSHPEIVEVEELYTGKLIFE